MRECKQQRPICHYEPYLNPAWSEGLMHGSAVHIEWQQLMYNSIYIAADRVLQNTVSNANYSASKCRKVFRDPQTAT